MKSPVISLVQGNFSQNKANFSILRSGITVTGRVLSRNENGTYTVSLAGQKIVVKSETPLKNGSVFSAKVSIKGESVNLSLVKENNESGEIFQKLSAGKEISPETANFLTSLGFEPDAESFKILSFMQSLGMKINAGEAKKALLKAKSRNDGEVDIEKAEIELLLSEKGIRNSVEVISGRNGEKGNSDKEKSDKKEWDEDKEKSGRNQGDMNSETVKKFFSSVDSAADTGKTGVLSAFNTILSKKQENPPLNHWLVFPFEWDFQNSSGTIRLLYDSHLKNLQKVIIDLKTSEKNNVFVLYYKNNEVDSVKFAASENLPSSKKSELCGILSAMFGRKIQVQLSDFGNLRGFCTGDEELTLLNGLV